MFVIAPGKSLVVALRGPVAVLERPGAIENVAVAVLKGVAAVLERPGAI